MRGKEKNGQKRCFSWIIQLSEGKQEMEIPKILQIGLAFREIGGILIDSIEKMCCVRS